jgi:hypothetical protein
MRRIAARGLHHEVERSLSVGGIGRGKGRQSDPEPLCLTVQRYSSRGAGMRKGLMEGEAGFVAQPNAGSAYAGTWQLGKGSFAPGRCASVI